MTAQAPDLLTYRGSRLWLFSNPLEAYFAQGHQRPDFRAGSTACWRGYVASWEIEQNTLYLLGITDEDGTRAVDLGLLFPGHQGRVEASWYTGELRAPAGKQLRYVHMGYASEYEQDLFFTLWHGKIVLTELFDNHSKQLAVSEVLAEPSDLFIAEEWSLIKASHAGREDGLTRLVYADWLEERGDRRCKWLRASAQLASLPEGDERRPSLQAQFKLPFTPLNVVWLRLLGMRYEEIRALMGVPVLWK